MYKLVAIDLDGTLLNSEKKVSEENRTALQLASEKDVKIVICSGRVFKGARVFARHISTNEPIIACNGALIKDMQTDDVLYANTVSKEDCHRIVDICHKENVYFHAYLGDVLYTEALKFGSAFHSKMNQRLPSEDRLEIVLADDMHEVVETNPALAYKFVAISDNAEQLAKTRSRICDIKTIDVMSSFYDNFEMVNHGVSKGNAVKFLCEKLDIKREEVIAIGDNENDLSMIQYAGVGVAMGNAESIVKDIADYITLDNDKNGVSDAIRKFILD